MSKPFYAFILMNVNRRAWRFLQSFVSAMDRLGFWLSRGLPMKHWLSALLVPSLLALRGAAQAQAPGPFEPWSIRQTRLIVSAERLFGVHAYSSSYEPAEG